MQAHAKTQGGIYPGVHEKSTLVQGFTTQGHGKSQTRSQGQLQDDASEGAADMIAVSLLRRILSGQRNMVNLVLTVLRFGLEYKVYEVKLSCWM